MTTKMRSLRDFRNPIGCLILLAALGAAAGCSTAESPGGSGTNMNHVLPSGSSVSGWLVVPSGGTHTSSATLDYIANGGSSGCTQCHGSDLSGGISNVSCLDNPAGCHHGPVAGWVAAPPAAQQHGVSAKKAPGSSGLASCQICHGADFRTVRGGMTCFTCHTLTPHAPRPWRGSPYTHTTTDTTNAPVCQQCHFSGSPNNPAGHPASPAPAGTPAGCFNNTLCHGEGGVAHPVPYNDGSHYTVTSATFPGSCSSCHDVSAPSVGPACQTCHVAASPLAAANCTSCHASPPDGNAPAGVAYPNLAGAHAKHLALATIPGGTNVVTCDTCHNGLGPSLLNLNHYNNAKTRVPQGDVAFVAPFPYTTGTATENATTLTCGSVSCHGAQNTLGWRTAGTTCTNCHKFTGTSVNGAPANYYNDYANQFISHTTHINRTACTTCHTALPAGTHFGTLGDKAIPSRAAAATINPAFGYPSPPPASLSQNNCNTNSVGGCH